MKTAIFHNMFMRERVKKQTYIYPELTVLDVTFCNHVLLRAL
jgi:hypothetical protein